MKDLKKYGVSFLYFLGILLIGILLLNTFSYFNIFGKTMTQIFSYLIFILSFFISGFINGKKSTKNGWLEGIKFSALLFIFIQIFNFLAFDFKFTFPYFIYECISILLIIFGSMIGINKKSST